MLVIKGLPARAVSVAFSPDGSLLAAGLGNNTARVWDGLTGSPAHEVAPLPPARAYDAGVLARFTPDGSGLVVADFRQGVGVWALDGRLVRELHPRRERHYRFRGVAVTPDGQVLTADYDEPLTRFDPADWVPVPVWAPAETQIGRALAPEPDGTRVAVGSGEVIDLRTGARVGEWRAGAHQADGLSWAAGRAAVAAHRYGPSVSVHDADTGARLAALTPSLKHTNAVCFTVDGRRLLTAGTEGVVRVYDADDWAAPPVEYDWNQGPVHALAVSPDGTRAAAGVGTSQRGKVVVWDLD